MYAMFAEKVIQKAKPTEACGKAGRRAPAGKLREYSAKAGYSG